MRERAVLALLSERSIKAAARRAGVDEATLRRWLAGDDGFRAAYDEARRTIFQSSMNRIQGLAELAAETLHDLLREKKHPAVRLGAARLVTEIGMHQHDADTILTKLGELEAAQRQQFRNGRG